MIILVFPIRLHWLSARGLRGNCERRGIEWMPWRTALNRKGTRGRSCKQSWSELPRSFPTLNCSRVLTGWLLGQGHVRQRPRNNSFKGGSHHLSSTCTNKWTKGTIFHTLYFGKIKNTSFFGWWGFSFEWLHQSWQKMNMFPAVTFQFADFYCRPLEAV